MKKVFLSLFIAFAFTNVIAQNVGIGTTEPMNKLHVNGSLLINSPTVATNTAPTVAQTKTMVNASTITFAASDSTGRIYDPGGPSGNYIANLLANVVINYNNAYCTGIEITVESMQLGTGDSLFISEASGYNTLLAVGNGYTTIGKWVFNSPLGSLYIIFKSNADANVGSGFSLLFRRLFDNSNSQPNVTGYAGKALYFDTKSGAFRSGGINNQAKGYNSNAMGDYTTASGNGSTALGSFTTASGTSSTAMGNSANATGDYSTALGYGTNASGYASMATGYYTTASGNFSTAMGKYTDATGYASTAMGDSTLASGNSSLASGYRTTASGNFSTAMGDYTNATGFISTAMGYNTTASGDHSTAMGNNTTASGYASMARGFFTTASGNYSTAMGNAAFTNGYANSFVIGGTGAATTCTSPNQFMTRFDNYTFWISASNYAYLLPSSNGWAYTSDRNKKERFEELNGETVLKKISNIPFSSWNFKAADTRKYRHYGITAQDFYTAFGKDSYGSIGNDTTVSPLDMLGVAYSAIKALEKRSTDLAQDNKLLKNENTLLKKNIEEIKNGYALANEELKNKLALLEVRLNDLAAIKEKDASAAITVAKQNK